MLRAVQWASLITMDSTPAAQAPAQAAATSAVICRWNGAYSAGCALSTSTGALMQATPSMSALMNSFFIRTPSADEG
jgi:hypothetical protein